MGKNPTTAELMTVARRAASAGAAVLAERAQVSPAGLPLEHHAHGVNAKSSVSDLVTDFDHRAEQAVREVLTALRPHDVVTGEEFGTTHVADPSGYRWSIDPLDGTTNFVRGIVYYATAVGLQAPDGQWVLGVVEAPALRRSWWGVRGQGSFTAPADGEPVRLGGPAGPLSAGLLATGFGYDPARRAQQVRSAAAMNEHFGNLRRLGAASLDICMVADGTQNAYAEYGIQEHDWSAAAVIAEEAGVPVRRPWSPDGTAEPDWCIVGDIGVDHAALEPLPTGL